MTYTKDESIYISKRIASRIYHTCKSYISRKKLKEKFISLDNPDCQIYNNDREKWTNQMIEEAVKLYILEGDYGRVGVIMHQKYDKIEESWLEVRNIKYHIAAKVKLGLNKLKQTISNPRLSRSLK